MRKKLLAFLLMTTFGLSSCANVKVDSNVLPETNGNDVPQINLPNSNITSSVDEEVKPTSGLIVGNAEENTLEKEEIYDQDGSLKVPFDIAYPEFMGDTLYDENSLLIKIEDNKASALPTILKSFNVDSYSFVTRSNKRSSWYKVHFEGYKSREIINDVRKIHPFIQMVDLNYIYNESNLDYEPSVEFANQPTSEVKSVAIGNLNNNPMYKNQWHFNNIGYAEAYKYIKKNNMPQGGAGITVAVIDTGVDIYHEDLKENIWTNIGEIPGDGQDNDGNGYIDDVHGVNIVDPTIEPLDDHGHGTHVAGIVAAENNNVGVVGVAYNAKIMPIKAADATGIFTQSNIASAINYAYLNGADVINMSFGGPNSSMVVEDALKAAYTDCVLVASAGNNGFVNEDFPNRPSGLVIMPNYPASLSYVLGVTSVGPSNIESFFTNIDGIPYTLQEYEVAAPGENIKSTLPNNKYGTLSGTSMSAPIISGMAAILRAYLKDQNKYPTKYIYAQIAGAASQTAMCCNPNKHGFMHNKTKIANLYESLSIYPRPNVNLFNYFIFDNKEFSSANNGDGRMDAGETIYLMPTLINRWGMSKNTTITFDTKSEISQEPSRYVKILQDTINFEGIGTYSTKTLLKLSEDLTSYEGIIDLNNALKFEISKDAPNGIGVRFNYSIKYKNGLEATDNILYQSDPNTSYFILSFNKGIVLPSIIRENTTLTKDNFYIVDSMVYIDKFAEVNVEPGTKIQFYSSDYDGLYKKRKPVGIVADGILNFNGTNDEKIELFPEQKEHFGFGFSLKNANLKYSKITNLLEANNVKMDHCIINCEFSTVQYHPGNRTIGAFYYYDKDSNTIEDKKISYYGVSAKNCLFNSLSILTSERLVVDFYNCVFKLSSQLSSVISFEKAINCSYVIEDFEESVTINKEWITPLSNLEITELDNNKYDINFLSSEDLSYNILNDFYKEISKRNIKYCDIPYGFNSSGSGGYILPVKVKKNPDSNYDIVSLKGEIIKNSHCSINLIDENKLYFAIVSLNNEGKISHCTLLEGEQEFSVTANYYFNMAIESSMDYKTVANEINDIFDKLYSLPLSYTSNVLCDYDNVLPSINISKNGNDNIDRELDSSIINLNTNNQQIADEVIFDGHDSINAPTLVDKGTEATWLKDCWPYVTKMELKDKNGVQKDTFNNELLNCRLYFNREMDMNVPLRVRFGSSKPYAEYEIPGKWVDAYTWEGTYTLDTTIENGTQKFRIEGGAAVDDSFLTVQEAGSRFKFNIDTTAAQAMMIQGNPTREGIELSWMQDDYDTLLGYNIYRSDSKDGEYTRVNKSVISKDEATFLDTTVEPGKTYWYTFTVVLSDLSESKPAGKSACTAFDTMNPNIYHSPVYQGYTDNDLLINCTITDNIGVTGAKVSYRTKGETSYKTIDMKKVNDRYSAKIPASEIGIAGIEYYISATDGTNIITNGSETNPYEVIIKDNAIISNKGDVDGDGVITVKDAYMIIKFIGDEIMLTPKEFKRADLNGNGNLETNEALKILQYINGVISSLN